MATASRFHEHFSTRTNSDMSSDVYKPPSFSAIRNVEKEMPGSNEKRKRLVRVQERDRAAMPLKQTSTLNCNGLVFRNTTFVPSADMVHFTAGPKSSSRGRTPRDKTPATLGTLAGFYLLPYALRKAAVGAGDRLEQRQRKKQTQANTRAATGRYDPDELQRRLATPSLGSSLDIDVPDTFEIPEEHPQFDIPPEHFEDAPEVVVVHEPEWEKVIDDDENWERLAEESSILSSSSGSSKFGTRLSDVVEVTELSEVGDVTVPMPGGGTEMLVRDWSSSEGEEEDDEEEKVVNGDEKRLTWKEV